MNQGVEEPLRAAATAAPAADGGPVSAPASAGESLYFAADLGHAGRFEAACLAATTERHHAEITAPLLQPVADAAAELSRSPRSNAVFELASGLPSPQHLRLIRRVLQTGGRAWLFWPSEEAIECVDEERLLSLRRHLRAVDWLKRIAVPIDRAVTTWQRLPTGLRWIYRGEFPVRRSDILIALTLLSLRAQPVPIEPSRRGKDRFSGAGVYLRADYWMAQDDEDAIRVPASLSEVTERIVHLTPRRGPVPAGVQRMVMDPPRLASGEDAIVLAPMHFRPIVKAACQALDPTYLYERLCAGQSVGAELSQVLGIPYIVEYPGSAALVRAALGGAPPFYPELYAKAEELALRQATVVIVRSAGMKEELAARGIDAARVLVVSGEDEVGLQLRSFLDTGLASSPRAVTLATDDAFKDATQNQWNQNPVGSQHARASQPRTLEWFLEIEKHRYGVYAPWMPETMEFARHEGREVLEIGGGIGTDLAQFARHGASVTDVDLAAAHLQLARENFRLRGLQGRFIHHDAESLPFADRSFDLVYSNGVLHHTPNTVRVVREIYRVLRPGGRAIVMVYAERSWHYWRKLVWLFGVKEQRLARVSMGEIMSQSVERSVNEARPLVKVYTRPRVCALFERFERVEIIQRQLLPEELPAILRWTLPFSERLMGWNLIVKATRPNAA